MAIVRKEILAEKKQTMFINLLGKKGEEHRKLPWILNQRQARYRIIIESAGAIKLIIFISVLHFTKFLMLKILDCEVLALHSAKNHSLL